MSNNIFIIGASSGLVDPLVQELSRSFRIFAVSRKFVNFLASSSQLCVSDYDDPGILDFARKNISRDDKNIFIFMNGVADSTIFANLPHDELHRICEVNFVAPAKLTQQLMSNLLRFENRFIYLSSSRALVGDVGTVMYTASKSALCGMVSSLSLEYGKFRQYFFLLSLGLFQLGLKNETTQTYVDRVLKTSAIKSFVDISELAKTISFLSENCAATGSIIHCDNGYRH